MTRIILVRHGQSISNAEQFWGGQKDFPLTELGKAQAEVVADAIRATEKVDVVYASDLERAYETGLAIAKRFDLPVIQDPNLREINTGRWTGTPIEGTKAKEPALMEKRKSDPVHFAFPEGESFEDLYHRGRKAITAIAEKNEGKCVVIASHGGILRTFETFVRYGTIEQIAIVSPPQNTAVSIYDYRDGVFTPIRYNWADHLLSKIQTNRNPNEKELL